MRVANIQEKILETIYTYLESNNIHDYNAYARYHGIGSIRNYKTMLEFAKDNMPLQDYLMLREKVFPFEPVSEDQVEEKQEFFNKVVVLANKFASNEIAYLHILDEIDVSLEKFHYMCKQLAYVYKKLSITKFKSIEEFCLENKGYNLRKDKITLEIASLKSNDLEKILSEIDKRNMPANNRVFMMAYDFYKKHILTNQQVCGR